MAMGRNYIPSDLAPRTISHFSAPITLGHPIGSGPLALQSTNNEGKVVTGQDRQGDQWQITVHGPGAVIVTDITPNDGSLDDEINSIQIIGSDPRRTYVTGQVTSSSRVQTDGTINFSYLTAENGVQSIILNGFNLVSPVTPIAGQPPNTGPAIYLPGGVTTLQFNNINGVFDQAANAQAIQIVIGDPSTPLRQRPNIKIGSVYNTVVNSALPSIPNGQPQTQPTVNFEINGQLHKLQMVSAGPAAIQNPGQQFNFPNVSVTGRTAIRALGIDQLKVAGSARNLVASRAGLPFQPQNGQNAAPPPSANPTVPFQSQPSGLNHLGSAEFGGTADGVGLDVNGPIGSLKFRRGLGDPTGVLTSSQNLGYNDAQRGYPSFGLLGGLITSTNIGHIQAGPNNLILQTPQNPALAQRLGYPNYAVRPGNALTSAAITSTGSIGSVDIVGNSLSSEIKTGFDYKSYIAGLQGVRAASHIGRFKQRGDLVDSVVSASYRPTKDVYGDAANFHPTDLTQTTTDVAGPGVIRGNLLGAAYFTGGRTALNYLGAGVYARTKIGHLPPPNSPARAHSVLTRP